MDTASAKIDAVTVRKSVLDAVRCCTSKDRQFVFSVHDVSNVCSERLDFSPNAILGWFSQPKATLPLIASYILIARLR